MKDHIYIIYNANKYVYGYIYIYKCISWLLPKHWFAMDFQL